MDAARTALNDKAFEKAAESLKAAREGATALGDQAPGWLAEQIARVQLELDSARLVPLADAAWATYEKKLGGAKALEIDPLEAVRTPAKWKGKTVRFEDFIDQAGSGFARGDYDLIAVVNGSAVAMKFDAGVKAALKEYSDLGLKIEEIHKTYQGEYVVTEAAHVGPVIATVTGTCRVTVTDDIDGTSYSAGTYEAPLVKVVALRQGPIAAASGQPAPVKSLPPR